MQELSESQKRELLKNLNVSKITEKHVSFTAAFKIKAVERYLKGDSANQIFLDAGIDPSFFKHNYCRSCIKRWYKLASDDGKARLKSDQRGKGATGRPKTTKLSTLSYDELQVIIEAQKEIIEELKKKKALAKKK